jgi:CDP-diacylglycerol--serine O-phosphatidyltransferase
MAIVFALQTDSVIIYVNDQFSSTFNIPEKLAWASICIGVAAIIDFLDGFFARLLHAASPLGKQLDSLSDVVSFGVAPGVIIYQLLRLSFARDENGLDVPVAWLLPAFIISCAAAYRLGKFNLIEENLNHFKGVPTPAVGLLVASFPLILHFNPDTLNMGNILVNKWVLYFIIILLSLLMVSNSPMLAVKFKNLKPSANIPQVILVIVGIIAAIFLHWVAVPLIFLLYILLSLAYKKSFV